MKKEKSMKADKFNRVMAGAEKAIILTAAVGITLGLAICALIVWDLVKYLG